MALSIAHMELFGELGTCFRSESDDLASPIDGGLNSLAH